VPPIRTQARAATILPNFVGLIFQVHNGKSYQDVRITEDMVGHKLGEFSAYVRKCRRNMEARSDTQQHSEALHLQADEEQVEGGPHGIGANPSLNDDTTEEDFVKYLYSTALGIKEFGKLTSTRDGPHVSSYDYCTGYESRQPSPCHPWNQKSPSSNMLNNRA
jgi:ribosomal protein S19